jgi:catechol 2,3-dioxygenase-like lactoylglutathione lyase family enzyme
VTIGIPVRDLSEATTWYRELLGSRTEIEPAPGVWEIELRPHCWLQLFGSEQAGESAGVVRVGVRDIEVGHARIRKLGADPSPIETVPGAVRSFEFRDPYGNRLSRCEVLGEEGDRGAA